MAAGMSMRRRIAIIAALSLALWAAIVLLAMAGRLALDASHL